MSEDFQPAVFSDTPTDSVGGVLPPTPPSAGDVTPDGPNEDTPVKVDRRTRAGRQAPGGRDAFKAVPTPRIAGARPIGRPPKTKTDYRPGLEGLGQMAAFALSFKSPPDAAAVLMHTPDIAAALNDLAQQKPEVAAVLDKILAAGPYGAILSAVVPLVVQVLVNHGKVGPGLMGTVSPEELLASVTG